MMQFDRISLGRQAKEFGFVRDTAWERNQNSIMHWILLCLNTLTQAG